MPFTPLHLGPGLLAKGLLGPRFSFMIFGGTQVLMDIEPLLGIIHGWERLHGPTHTFWGATGIALLATLIGPPLSHVVLRWISQRQKTITYGTITWKVALASALLGAWSHVLLDAIMHWDVQPFAPFWSINPWRGVIPVSTLHWLCLGTALPGGYLIWRTKQKRPETRLID